jgi:transposase
MCGREEHDSAAFLPAYSPEANLIERLWRELHPT